MNQMLIQREDTIAVDKMLGAATEALLTSQRDDGHWVFELEADATIPSEYVLLVHHLAETPNLELAVRNEVALVRGEKEAKARSRVHFHVPR